MGTKVGLQQGGIWAFAKCQCSSSELGTGINCRVNTYLTGRQKVTCDMLTQQILALICVIFRVNSRVGNSLIEFRSESLVFCQKKVSKWAICSKSVRFAHSLIFGESPGRFAHDRSFLLSDLSKLLTVAHLSWVTWAIRSLRSEGMSKPLAFLKLSKNCKKHKKIRFFPIFLSKSLYFW